MIPIISDLYSMIPIRPIKIGKANSWHWHWLLDWIDRIHRLVPAHSHVASSCDEEAKAETLWMFNRSKSLLDWWNFEWKYMKWLRLTWIVFFSHLCPVLNFAVNGTSDFCCGQCGLRSCSVACEKNMDAAIGLQGPSISLTPSYVYIYYIYMR